MGTMSLYGQEAEAALLARFLARLDRTSYVDVGAERGAFVAALLEVGSDVVHAIEPEPENAAFLRARFESDSRVVVHESAASEVDEALELRKSVGADGSAITSGHTVLSRPSTEQIAWKGV